MIHPFLKENWKKERKNTSNSFHLSKNIRLQIQKEKKQSKKREEKYWMIYLKPSSGEHERGGTYEFTSARNYIQHGLHELTVWASKLAGVLCNYSRETGWWAADNNWTGRDGRGENTGTWPLTRN